MTKRPVVSEKRIAAVLAALDVWWTNNYCSPTLRELADGSGLRAQSNVKGILDAAERLGRLRVLRVGQRNPAYIPLWVVDAIQRPPARFILERGRPLDDGSAVEMAGPATYERGWRTLPPVSPEQFMADIRKAQADAERPPALRRVLALNELPCTCPGGMGHRVKCRGECGCAHHAELWRDAPAEGG